MSGGFTTLAQLTRDTRSWWRQHRSMALGWVKTWEASEVSMFMLASWLQTGLSQPSNVQFTSCCVLPTVLDYTITLWGTATLPVRDSVTATRTGSNSMSHVIYCTPAAVKTHFHKELWIREKMLIATIKMSFGIKSPHMVWKKMEKWFHLQICINVVFFTACTQRL